MSPSSVRTDGNAGSGSPEPPSPRTTAVALVDARGVIVGWSPGAQRLLGYGADDVVGAHVSHLLSGAVPSWRHALVTLGAVAPLRARAGWSSLLTARHRDGHPVPLALDVSPLTVPGQGEGWLLSALELFQAHASRAATSPAVSALLKDALLERAPIAFTLWDTRLRVVWLNDVAAAQADGPRESLVNRSLDEAGRAFDLAVAVPAVRGVIETGEPVIDHEIRKVLPDGTEKAFSVSIFRLDGADGTPLGVCTLGIDASSSAVRRHMVLLSRAGTRIGTTLDIVTTAQELADAAVPAVADFVSVDLSDWAPRGAAPRERLDYSGFGSPAFRRAGMASIRPGVPEAIFSVGDVVFHPPSSPVMRTLATGESHFEPRLDTAHYWLRRDPLRGAAIKQAHMHSAIVVPLKARGEILGVATFGRTDNPVSFSRDDLFLAEELCVRAALSLDNARRYSREREAALALQRDLLPDHLPNQNGLEVFSRYLPSDKHGVGGDWYDVIPLPGGRIGMVVGDVVGHGINAAASMGRLRTAVNTLAEQCLQPHELLARLDRVALRLSRRTAAPNRLGIPNLAATCVYAMYDPATRVCTIARAGHPPPLVVTPDGRAEYCWAPAGAPLGWGLSSYESLDVELPEKSLVALFTDGLIETRDDDIGVGLGRLVSAFGSCGGTGSLAQLGARVIDTMARDTAAEDDIALLLARTRPAL